MADDVDFTISSAIKIISVNFLCNQNPGIVQKCIDDLCQSGHLDVNSQKTLLIGTLHHPQILKYPPARKYARKFLKYIIQKLEDNNIEVLEEFYMAYNDSLCTSGDDEEFSYKTYALSGDKYVTLEESTLLISKGTTGLQTWRAGQFLADFVIENPNLFTGRSVIELGCGLGLTGIVACQYLSLKRYIFTDGSWEVLNQLKKNLEINSIRFEDTRDQISGETGQELCNGHESGNQSGALVTNLVQLDWNNIEGSQLGDIRSDIILGADVMYDPGIIPALMNTLTHLMSSGCIGYLAATVRNEETFNSFTSAIESSGLQYEILPGPKKEYFLYDQPITIRILKVSVIK